MSDTKLFKQSKSTLRSDAEQVLQQKVVSAKQINSNTVAAHVVEQAAHDEYVMLANGMRVPIVENRKQRRIRLSKVRRSIKKGGKR